MGIEIVITKCKAHFETIKYNEDKGLLYKTYSEDFKIPLDHALQVKGQIAEAISILESGTEYEKLHVIAILRDAL